MIKELESINLRKWYMETYPTDDLGECLNATATFNGLLDTLNAHEDVYDYIGEGDSVIRERMFSKLSELLKCDYDVIYYKWLGR